MSSHNTSMAILYPAAMASNSICQLFLGWVFLNSMSFCLIWPTRIYLLIIFKSEPIIFSIVSTGHAKVTICFSITGKEKQLPRWSRVLLRHLFSSAIRFPKLPMKNVDMRLFSKYKITICNLIYSANIRPILLEDMDFSKIKATLLQGRFCVYSLIFGGFYFSSSRGNIILPFTMSLSIATLVVPLKVCTWRSTSLVTPA